METIAELEVKEFDHSKRIMYLAKQLLLSQERMNLIAGTNSAPVATISAENLVRFGYVTIENIQTLTEVKNDRRFIKLIITIKKTNDFKKIFDANEEEVKKKKEEREKQAKEKTKQGK